MNIIIYDFIKTNSGVLINDLKGKSITHDDIINILINNKNKFKNKEQLRTYYRALNKLFIYKYDKYI